MEHTGPTEKSAEGCEQPHPLIDEAKHRLKELDERAKAFIKEHPAACLVGALALGYVVARLARWRS